MELIIEAIFEQQQQVTIKEICKDMEPLKIEKNVKEFADYLTPCDELYLNEEEK